MYVRKQSLTAILGVTAALAASSALADTANTTMATWFDENPAATSSTFGGGDGAWSNATEDTTNKKIVATDAEQIALYTPTYGMDGTSATVTFTANFPYPNDDTSTAALTGAQAAFRLTTADATATPNTYKFQVWAGTTPSWQDVTVSSLTPNTNVSYTVTLAFTYGTTSSFSVTVNNTAATGAFTPANTPTKVSTVGFIGEGDLTSISGQGAAVATVTSGDVTTSYASMAAASAAAKAASTTVTIPTDAEVAVTVATNAATYASMATGTYTVKTNGAEMAVGVIQEPAQKTSLIAVPFNGLNGSAVTVATLFSNTAGLSVDDTLSVYKDNQYYNYSWDGTKWEGQSGAETTMALTAGTGAILTRSSTSGTVSIVGTTTTAEAQTVATGTVGIGANTGTAAKKVSDLTVSATTTATAPVRIYKIDSTTGKNVQYAKGGNDWVKQASKTVTVEGEEVTIYYDGTVNESDTIPAGQGFYIDNASESNTTVQ